jgi:hypothetical protein
MSRPLASANGGEDANDAVDPHDDSIRHRGRLVEPLGWVAAGIEDPGGLVDVIAVAAELGSGGKQFLD